jgi:SAM-dependent methyltransferase
MRLLAKLCFVRITPQRVLSTSRLMSSKNEPPKFDKEMAELYHRIADNHFHKDGPWNLMINAIKESKASTLPAFSVLDLASGHGEPSMSIAKTFPHAEIFSTDFSEDMVALAEKASKDIPNMSVQIADMQNLQFDADQFDIITCSYGFMFPPDKDRALKEAHRCLRPGGTLIATTWDELHLLQLVGSIMTKVLGQTPPPPPLNPMSLSEPLLFENMLKENGFKDVQSKQSTYPFDLGDDEEMRFKMTTMLVKGKLDELDAWDQAREAYDNLFESFVTVDDNGNSALTRNTFKLTVCRKAE